MIDQQDTHLRPVPRQKKAVFELTRFDYIWRRNTSRFRSRRPPAGGLKLSRTADRQDTSHLSYTLQQTRQMLRIANGDAHVDGSRRLRAIGSGVHHLDRDFFSREQIAD